MFLGDEKKNMQLLYMMKKPIIKGKKTKPKATKPKTTRQNQKQQQNVNVKINIDQSKKTKKGGGKGGKAMIPSYQSQPISSYPLFREEPQQAPIHRNEISTHTITDQENNVVQNPVRNQTPMIYNPISREVPFTTDKPAGIASYKSVEKNDKFYDESFNKSSDKSYNESDLYIPKQFGARRNFEQLSNKEQEQSKINKKKREEKKSLAEKEKHWK
jgi:hypothetical protein